MVRDWIVAWLAWLMQAGTLPGDSPDERLHKAILTLSTAFISALAVLWVTTYWALGLPLSAAIPFGYQIFSVLSLIYFVRKKNFKFFRLSQLGVMLVLPFLLQWTLGGFVNSSGVMMWAFIAPIGALLFQGPREAGPWLGAYLVLALGAGLFDGLISRGAPPIPTWVIVAFFVMNIGGVSATTYALLRYFALERQRALEALNLQHRILQEEQARSERLLLNVLPKPIAERLKRDPTAIADGFPEATVLFADVVDFTRMSAAMTPERVVAWLNDLFSLFDTLSERCGLEKIKTVGDAYMAAAGLPMPRPDHAQAAAEMALEIQRQLTMRTAPNGEPLCMRIGIHTGPVVAGVIGTKKFIYDLWGDTVNTASRMESHGVAGAIQVTEAAYERLKGAYEFEDRGIVHVKGKGEMRTYLLIGRREAQGGTVAVLGPEKR